MTKHSRRPPKPLNSALLRDLALAYVARFSTSSGKLEAYLARKLRERGWEDDDNEGGAGPDIPALVTRYVELGYIDDAAYAQSRADGLLRRGYGARRVAQDLKAAGIAETMLEDAMPDEATKREAALALARKRRFGPFYEGEWDAKRRDKQIAAMLRAGHGFAHISAILDAESVEEAEIWVSEARDG